ncbi:MAG: hypothetical protein JO103_03280 [Candidatus Eremiobacteraeota bacterium]|nr:hypothetical protein [Candidatus Eremiobacteraeota bacterium]MBV9407606.1 hypothetical protein [Candidatus Eremiobacteraeota bacterium]
MQYGTRFTARCDGPDVRVIAPDDHVTCAIDAPDAPDIVATRVDAEPKGYDEFLAALPSGDTAVKRFLGSEIAAAAHGGVTFPGSRMERYLHAIAGGYQHEALRRHGLLGNVRCPAQITLSPSSAPTHCTARLGRQTEHYDLHVAYGGGLEFDETKQHVVVVLSDVREVARRAFEHRLGGGLRGNKVRVRIAVQVDCGHDDVALVTVGGEVPCTATWYRGSEDQPFDIDVHDEDGSYTLEDDG